MEHFSQDNGEQLSRVHVIREYGRVLAVRKLSKVVHFEMGSCLEARTIIDCALKGTIKDS